MEGHANLVHTTSCRHLSGAGRRRERRLRRIKISSRWQRKVFSRQANDASADQRLAVSVLASSCQEKGFMSMNVIAVGTTQNGLNAVMGRRSARYAARPTTLLGSVRTWPLSIRTRSSQRRRSGSRAPARRSVDRWSRSPILQNHTRGNSASSSVKIERGVTMCLRLCMRRRGSQKRPVRA